MEHTVFICTVLGFELRATHLLGRPLPLGSHPPTLFALTIFWLGSSVLAGTTGTLHHTQLIGFEMGSL
jgi:hypothetical protein